MCFPLRSLCSPTPETAQNSGGSEFRLPRRNSTTALPSVHPRSWAEQEAGRTPRLLGPGASCAWRQPFRTQGPAGRQESELSASPSCFSFPLSCPDSGSFLGSTVLVGVSVEGPPWGRLVRRGRQRKWWREHLPNSPRRKTGKNSQIQLIQNSGN